MTATDTVAAARHRRNIKAYFHALGMLPILILIGLLFQILSGYGETGSLTEAWSAGRFLSVQNLSIVAQQASINTVLAAGMTFVILTGGIDLSVGSVLAASAMVAVMVSLIPDGFGHLGIPAGIFLGMILGFVNGALIAFAKLPPFIVTLGTLTAVRGLARLLGDDKTVFNPELPFAFINGTAFLGISWLSLIAFAVILVSWFILRFRALGVRIYAVGGNEVAARLSGIKVWAVLLFVYVASGFLAGLGGVMSSTRLLAANGLQLGQGYELDAIAAVILGGTSFVGGVGTIWGTLIGALIIAVLSNGLILTGVSDVWQFIIKGLVIIGAVALDRYRLKTSART
ncbi:ribose ABC transporter permease [Ochrobactrum sp. Marseille-Q0166]|uniref:ABC transporter permease subunit n=1 Tax=Ochrobactrum sp. Marseille-Q0166 TaxID=2761105 RepID=UPI001654F738|nr:ribose ABC transporter permease [Ochrobactrum sp. Marseille-Q0166]MBC8718982.1 ribose ABC transporter permease [Ochrobactrum sp. Marseille-Q0166]